MCMNPGFWSGFFCGIFGLVVVVPIFTAALAKAGTEVWGGSCHAYGVCYNAVQHPFIIGSDGFDERFFFAVSALQGKHCSYISFMVAGAVDCALATGLRSKFPEPIYFSAS